MDIVEGKIVFTTPTQNNTNTLDNFSLFENINGSNLIGYGSSFSPLAPPFQSRIHTGNDVSVPHLQQEPHIADTAPLTAGIEQTMKNLYLNNDTRYNNVEYNSYTNGSKVESPLTSNTSNGSEEGGTSTNTDTVQTLEFLVKCMSAANFYFNSLTREESLVLKEMRPSVLHKFMSEITRIQMERRLRRPLANLMERECAFCKNNGENEDSYSSHVLKDWRGRVLCPVLRAFRCPRCGATGDRAHTIKYCPESFEGMLRSGNLASRRRTSGSLSLSNQQLSASSTPPTPVSSPNGANSPFTSIWSPLE